MQKDDQIDLAGQYLALVKHETNQMDVSTFLLQHSGATSEECLQVLVADQLIRIESGESRTVEVYIAMLPELSADTLLELAINEYRILSSQGRSPSIVSYTDRFPELADSLRERLTSIASEDGTVATQAAPPDTIDVTSPGTGVPVNYETVDYLAQSNSPHQGSIGELGDYELLSEIARGGMGVVYLARHRRLKRQVALKMILAGQFASQEEVQRFLSEAEAAAQLEHPNIVPIYEIGEEDGKHYFSMAYVEGQSLSNLAKEGPLPPRESVELMVKIADAVEYAHSKGIVHRDLKPANILLDGNGEPRVTDFGLAKNVASDSGLTASGQVMGTPSYMPPEQAAGRIDQIGPVSDVYSLGAVLYDLLTGRPPFRAATLVDTLKQVMEQEPVAPHVLNPSVDRDLETICLKCLSKEILKRYASAQDLSDELKRYLAGEPILARRISAAGRAIRWCKRKPIVAGLCAAVCLAVIAFGTAFAANRAANRTRVLAELRTEFESNLDQPSLTASYLESMESTARAIGVFEPEDAIEARDRLYMRFKETIESDMRQSGLSRDDGEALRGAIDVLAERKPELAKALHISLDRRFGGWSSSFDLQAPFDELSTVFGHESTRSGDTVRRTTPPASDVRSFPTARMSTWSIRL
jgi:tRNA A-37 threonylcarbamoyl transferase component Bud32